MIEIIHIENRKETFYANFGNKNPRETLGIQVSGNMLENSPDLEEFVNATGYTKIIVTSLRGFNISPDFLENCPDVKDLELPLMHTKIDGVNISVFEDDRLQSLFKNPYFKVHKRLF
jgi:hypothetical protein